MLAEDEEALKSTSISPEGIYDLISCGYEDLLVVDIRSVEDYRGCHMRGAVHFSFDADHAESKRHKAIRFYREMQRLERTWFTRVIVVTDLDDPLTEEADTMPISPDVSKHRQSKGLEFADVIKSAPGMKRIAAIWIIDGGFVTFKNKYPYLCVSTITIKREEPLFRNATRKIQEYYTSMPRDLKVPFAGSLATPSSSAPSPSSPPSASPPSPSPSLPSPSACPNEACTTPGCTAPSARPVRSLASASKYIRCNPCKWPSRLVDDFLYLGDYETACNPLALKALRIGRVINCTPDRINLWEKRPWKRRRVACAADDDEDKEKTEHRGEEDDESDAKHHEPTSSSSSSTSASTSTSPTCTPAPAAHVEEVEEEVNEEPMASVLFPEVKIDEYLRIAVLDNYCDSIADYFDQSISFIEKAKENSQAVLVHCAQGISRSVTIAIAYLMKVEGMTLREAHDLVRRKRPVSKPNVGFLKQLAAFELQLHGTSTMPT